MLEPGQWLDALAAFYDRYGYALVFFGSLGENTALVGLFLPGSALALLGGFYARQGTLNITWVILLTWWAMVLGYQVDYVIGRFLLARMAEWWSATTFGRRLRLAGRLRLARAIWPGTAAKRFWPRTPSARCVRLWPSARAPVA